MAEDYTFKRRVGSLWRRYRGPDIWVHVTIPAVAALVVLAILGAIGN